MVIKKFFIKKSICFLFIYSFLVFSSLFSDSKLNSVNNKLKINLITQENGRGLNTDLQVLVEALEQLDCSVTILDILEAKWNRAHINIFIQVLIPEKFPMAKQNWFIPNPEWYEQPLSYLNHVDLILCRTKEIERIFRKMNKPTYYLGFTSPDSYREDVQKDYRHLFHLGGGSFLRGTVAIKDIWQTHPTFPLLKVISFYFPFSSHSPHLEWFSLRLPEERLRKLQNQCGIHLCPSETEGFGHYIMEGMSACAVVLTTDAPPMNEFIKDQRCLVPYIKASPLNLATQYQVDPLQLQSKIEYLLSLPLEELQEIGEQNRAVYLQKRQEFYERLEELIWTALPLMERE